METATENMISYLKCENTHTYYWGRVCAYKKARSSENDMNMTYTKEQTSGELLVAIRNVSTIETACVSNKCNKNPFARRNNVQKHTMDYTVRQCCGPKNGTKAAV